jgi:hypothetical protein
MASKNIQAQQKQMESTTPNKVAEAAGQATDPNPQDKEWGITLNGRKDPMEVVGEETNKSKAIRMLAAAGYTNAEIVKISRKIKALQYKDGREIRYQHVRNVMSQKLANAS